MAELEPRPELRNAPAVAHGAADASEVARLGFEQAQVRDFSANVNPFAPWPTVRAALAAAAPAAYPDRAATALRRGLADRHGVSIGRTIAGNGSVELLWLIGLAMLRAGDAVTIAGPTFGEYERIARLMGARPMTCRARESDGFAPPVDELEKVLGRDRPRVAFFCHPNNPTGASIDLEWLGSQVQRHPGTLFVVDEAYIELTRDVASAAELVEAGWGNVLVLRSMTKAHGLAGVRLGYALGSEPVVGWLHDVAPPWHVSEPAQAAGAAAMAEANQLAGDVDRLFAGKGQLLEGLKEAGLPVVEAAPVPFCLAKVGDAEPVRAGLAQRGLLVRDCSSFGLPQYIRISPRHEKDNAMLIEAMKEALPCYGCS